MPTLTVVYWRDIPAQVIVKQGRKREKVPLENRFIEAIDRAAMRAGKGSSDLYLAEWRRESAEFDPVENLRNVAEDKARELEQAFTDDALSEMIRNHGNTPGQG